MNQKLRKIEVFCYSASFPSLKVIEVIPSGILRSFYGKSWLKIRYRKTNSIMSLKFQPYESEGPNWENGTNYHPHLIAKKWLLDFSLMDCRPEWQSIVELSSREHGFSTDSLYQFYDLQNPLFSVTIGLTLIQVALRKLTMLFTAGKKPCIT